jgi:TnpA family transposase
MLPGAGACHQRDVFCEEHTMPIGFLTTAERDRLNRFPDPIPDEDLRAFFLLSEADQQAINQHREAHARLGFALQLCALRYLGFAPDDLQTAPAAAVAYVAQQLGVVPQALTAYGMRRPTRTTHFQQVQMHLHFRLATPLDWYALQTWVGERALEHDKPTLLLQLACDKLRREQIVRPGLTRLERLIATARQRAHAETFHRLTLVCSPERHALLDGLLTPDSATGRTLLNWLRREATAHTAPQLVESLAKLTFLLEAGVDTWDLTSLNPNRVKWLAQLGWKASVAQLQRMESLRRYPILVAFLHQALHHHTDVAVELYDQCLWEYHGAAKQELVEFRTAIARSTNDKLRLLRELGQVLLDPEVADVAVRAESFARVPEPVLRAAVEETQGLLRPRHDDAIDFFGTRYSTIRQFAPTFLRTLTFHAQGPEDTVLRAVEVIRTLDRAPTRRPVPLDAPMALVTDVWRPYIRDADGSISRRYYELCTLWHLRSALRAGNIWVAHSRRYANPDTYLIPPAEWPRWRPEVIRQTETPSDGATRLAKREAELERTMAEVERLLARKDSAVRVEKDQIVLSPLEADPRPASAKALADRITERLPRVELSELLIEVDTWTHFSQQFCHAADAETPRATLLPSLYASLVAHACNFGLDQMAHLTDLAYDYLAWCTTWFLREDTLKAACNGLVNYHHRLPLSQAWGSGVLSSSDGQRFPVSGKTRHARRMPPSLGYGMGVTFYSWSSDQLSQYGTKFVPVTVRDSTYVLDEICHNETELPIREHTTDTAGATEIIFALFDLLGFRFAPRLRDLNDRRLFASGPIDMQRYPRLQPHVTGRTNRLRILDGWDEMLRVAGSMKLGWVTASLFVQKLQAHPQQNALARALQEYGRLARTLHILRWYAYPEDRRRFLRQLNKGEALHDLRAALVIANKGQLRQRRGDALAHQALCLNLVTNAVIVWNTVYMAAVVEQLKQEGVPVQDSDLAHIWPTRYAHINVYGKYHFNVEEAHTRKGLRPLRPPGQRA